MADERTSFRSSKSIAGIVLAGLGIFMLYEDVSGVAAGLRHVLAANGWGGLGWAYAAVMSVLHLQLYAAHHHRLLHDFICHFLASCWPLLLVSAGAAGVPEDALMRSLATFRKKIGELVDLTAGRSTSK